MDDEVYIYELDAKDSMGPYQLYEVYQIRDEGAPILGKFGSWSGVAGVNSSLNITKKDKNSRRSDLRVSFHLLSSTCSRPKVDKIRTFSDFNNGKKFSALCVPFIDFLAP